MKVRRWTASTAAFLFACVRAVTMAFAALLVIPATAAVQPAAGTTAGPRAGLAKARVMFCGDSITGQRGERLGAENCFQIKWALKQRHPDATPTLVALGGSGMCVGNWIGVERNSKTSEDALDVKEVGVKARLDQPSDERVKAGNPRISHLTMWHHAPSGQAFITVAEEMNLNALAVNPPGVFGVFFRDANGRSYVVEHAIPWRVLHTEDDPPQRGDTLAAVWQVHWSDETGRLWRDQLVEIRDPYEPRGIIEYERAATWGQAEFRER